MRHSMSKDTAFNGETTPRHTFLCSDLQCLPPGDPRILCAKHGYSITGKSFIRSLLYYLPHGPDWEITYQCQITLKSLLIDNLTFKAFFLKLRILQNCPNCNINIYERILWDLCHFFRDNMVYISASSEVN